MGDIPGTNLTSQQLLEMYVAYQLISALVQSLPSPAENGNVIYATVYKFLSLVVADFKGFTQKGLPKSTKAATPPETENQ